ncbi:MAG: valine--tRNA ligase, partial [Acetivibrio sp.]
EEAAVEMIKTAVKGIRNVRAEMNVPPSKKATVIVVSEDENIRNTFKENNVFFSALGYASEVLVKKDKSDIPEDAVSTVIHGAIIYMPFAELVDLSKEIERLEKEKIRLEGELKRVKGMLSNERFVSKAPKEKIEEEKAKLEKYTNMMEQVTERLNNLKK